MLTKTLINKIKKAGFKPDNIEGRTNTFTVINGRNIVSFHNQDGEAICLHCGYVGQQADSQTDYFPGVFADNGKQLVNFLNTGSRFGA